MSGLTIRSDSLVNKDNTGAPEFLTTVGIDTGYAFSVTPSATTHYNCTGVTTSGPILITQDANVAGVITGTSFKGSGVALSGITTASLSKSLAYKLILGDPPLQS